MEDKKAHNITLLLLFVVGTFFFVEVNYRYWYHFMEQYAMFRQTGSYLLELMKQPGGFIEYVAECVMIAFAWPYWAAAIIALLLGVISCFFFAFMKRCGVRASMWVAVLPAFLFWIYPVESVAIMLAVGAGLKWGYTYARIQDWRIRYAVGLLLITVAYFLAAPAHLLLAMLVATYEYCTGQTKKKYIVGAAAVAWSLLLPLLAMRTLYVLPMREAFIGRHLFHPEHPVPLSFWLLWCSFPLLTLLAYGLRNRVLIKRERLRRVAMLLSLVAAIAYGIAYGKNPMEQAYRYDYYARCGQWNRIVNHALRHSIKDKDALIYLNLALSHTGQLNERLLQFPQIGEAGLISQDPTTRLGLIEASEVAWHLGLINSAQRFAFVGVLSSERCIQPRLMKRLVETYLVNEEYKAAAKYIKILESAPAHASWAQQLQALPDAASSPQTDCIEAKRRFAQQTDNPFDPTKSLPSTIAFMLDDHPDNRPAFEYGMAYLLLYKDLNPFMHYMRQMRDRKEALPVLYQEAICLYFAAMRQDAEEFRSFGIDGAVYQRLVSFMQAAKGLSPAVLKQQYGNTYYYYAQFVTPPNKEQG